MLTGRKERKDQETRGAESHSPPAKPALKQREPPVHQVPTRAETTRQPPAATVDATEQTKSLPAPETPATATTLSTTSTPPTPAAIALSARPHSSAVSYHALNEVFHRTFPLANELDISVEAFVIASSSTDIELQPADGGLSISQLEALQEAHLRAYHYLNEKKVRSFSCPTNSLFKERTLTLGSYTHTHVATDCLPLQMELARVLEAQRLEAHFALQNEILSLNE